MQEDSSCHRAATCRAFCHAGGSAHAWSELAARLRNTDLQAVDYPGHGRRAREDLVDDLPRLIEDAAREAPPAAPYFLLGHSMGARVAAGVARRFEQTGRPGPRFVVVSGASAPGHDQREPIHHLDDEGFLDGLDALGGLPPAVRDEPLMREFFLPILRADLRAVERWRPGDWKLSVPIVALRGRRDEVSERSVRAWRERTATSFAYHEVEGGHFFPFERPHEVAALLDAVVSELL